MKNTRDKLLTVEQLKVMTDEVLEQLFLRQSLRESVERVEKEHENRSHISE